MVRDREAMLRDASRQAFASMLVAGYYLGADGIEQVDPQWWPREYVEGCRHLDEPQMMFSHLSDPATVRCSACSLAFMRAAVEVDPDRCDWCGEVAPDRRFHETVIRNRNVLCLGNVCRLCRETGALNRERPSYASGVAVDR